MLQLMNDRFILIKWKKIQIFAVNRLKMSKIYFFKDHALKKEPNNQSERIWAPCSIQVVNEGSRFINSNSP